MAQIDICLVAGRRPVLIERTLASFADRLFRHFTLRQIYVNIDPLFGDEAELAQAITCIRGYFPDAQITTPTQPNFCAAVRENWRRTAADYVLHIEDDWLLNVDITPDILRHFDDPSVAQVSFNTKEKGFGILKEGRAHTVRRKRRIFGVKLFRYAIPFFTTSPSILRGSFARQAASLLDVRLDPEKQFSSMDNPTLERFAFRFKNYLHAVPDHYVATDIGREWRDQRGIRKVLSGCVSSWVLDET